MSWNTLIVFYFLTAEIDCFLFSNCRKMIKTSAETLIIVVSV
jgi:hypothetical protein